MSRSRRPVKMPRCSGCGRGYVPYCGDHNRRHGRRISDCPVLHYPHMENDRFTSFLKKRSDHLPED